MIRASSITTPTLVGLGLRRLPNVQRTDVGYLTEIWPRSLVAENCSPRLYRMTFCVILCLAVLVGLRLVT